MEFRARHLCFTLVTLALGACATMAPHPTLPSDTLPPRIEAGPGRYEGARSPETVAELRAAPAGQAEILDSQSPAGDERILVAKGYVRIGDGYYNGNDAKARDWLTARARDVGADRVQIYADNAHDAPSLHAVYYVKFKLPFGASFRDLHADEREAVGGSGVSLGDVIGNSPADQANLLKGDIVLKFNGEAVRDRAHFQQLLRAHMGKRATLTVSRDGATLSRQVRLGVLASEADGLK